MEDSPDRMDWTFNTPSQAEQYHQQVDSAENRQLVDPRRPHPNREFEHHYSPSQFEILNAQENFEDHQASHHQTQSQPTPPHPRVQVEPFNHGRRRNFDEFAHGEPVELNRVHRPLVLPGRVYVPPMDFRGLNAEEALALRQHVLELRRQNLDAELRGNVNQHGVRAGEWCSYLLQQLVHVSAAIAHISTTFICGVFHGAVRSGRFTYRNRQQIPGAIVFTVQSTYNAAKRRLVTVFAPLPVIPRVRLNLRPPLPRRRNGVIRQPPMTSNLARWNDELQAGREEALMVMQGVEPDPAAVSDNMMSGAIMDLDEENYIDPHHNPFNAPLPIDTTALDACVRDTLDQNALPVSLATNREDGKESNSFMSDPEHLRAQQHPKVLRQNFVDFDVPPLVESHDSRFENQFASAGGPSSPDIAVLNDPNAIASSSSELAMNNRTEKFTPVSSDTNSADSALSSSELAMNNHTEKFTPVSSDANSADSAPSSSELAMNNHTEKFTPVSSDTKSADSALITATGAIESDLFNILERRAESIMPESRKLSIEQASHKTFASTIADDIYSDLSDDAEEQELPLCDFQGGTEQSIFMEICRATNADMGLELESSIASDEAIESPSAQAKTTVPIELTTPPEAELALNATNARKSEELELSHTAVNINEEQIPSSSSTHQIPKESQEPQVSHISTPISIDIDEEEMDLPLSFPPTQNESQQTFLIPATTSKQIEDQEGPSLPGSFTEDEGAQQPFSRPSHFETTEQQASSATPTASSDQHDPSLLKFTPRHDFEQENFPLSSEQPDRSIPISSVQILEEKSSGQTTPTQSYGQRSSLSLASLTGLPDQQSFPPSPAQSELPGTSVPNRKQPSPKSNVNTPKRIAKKSVMFFQSPKTGRPITKTRKYVLGESMDYPVSSSPAPSSVMSKESSILEFDSPTTIAETEALSLSLAYYNPSTAESYHHWAEKPELKEEGEFETVSQMGKNLEAAGIWTSDKKDAGEVMLEAINSTAGSLEADKPIFETQSPETTADSLLIEREKPSLEIQSVEMTADNSLMEPDKPAAAKAGPEEIGLVGADMSTAESIGASMAEGSSAVGADEAVIETKLSEMTADKPAREEESPAGSLLVGADISTAEDVDTTMTDGSPLVRADKPVIEKDSIQETAGSSRGEADKPAEEEDIATDQDEDIATTRGKFSESLHDSPKLAKPESSRRKSTPNRHPAQPARKSLRLQNKSARISPPPRPAKLADKMTILDLSGGYGTTAKTSKHHRRALKAEQARVKQEAIEAAEEARRVKEEAEEKARKEAEEAKEKARVAKEEAEENARRKQEEEEERQSKTTRRIPKEKVIQPLSAKWEATVQAAMDTPDMRTVLVTLPSGTKLTRKDFGTLKVVPGRDPSHGWLNDEIILASLQQVVDYGLRVSNHVAGKTPKYHAFNTFFYKNLRDKGAQSIKRWATKAKIGGRALEEVERVFIPVHQGAHWTLLVVSPVARTIEYFDSMGGVAESYIHNTKLWLATEMGQRFKDNEWTVPTGTHGVGPRQTNGSDCGVFTCTTARMVALGIDPMAYSGEDMCVQRGRMVAELLNGGLVGDFDPKVEF